MEPVPEYTPWSELAAGFAAGGGAAAFAIAPIAPLTESHTCFWSFATIACCRTAGCTMMLSLAAFAEVPNLSELSVQRPCSMQNTERSIGSAPAGTILSFAMIRSCLPPVTISPASNNSGRFELFTSTSVFTWSPWYACETAPPRGLTRPRTLPASVTSTSPLLRPSSSVRNWSAGSDFPSSRTTGKSVRSPLSIGFSTR